MFDPAVRYAFLHADKHDASKGSKVGGLPSSNLAYDVVMIREMSFVYTKVHSVKNKTNPHTTNVMKTVVESGSGLCINMTT